MVKALARSEKEGFVLVTLYYGTDLGTQARYTDWDQAYSGHSPEPRMSVRVAENGGTFNKREVRVVLPVDAFTRRASSGVPHSPVFLKLREVTLGLEPGDQNSELTLFRGRVIRVVRNFHGQADKVGFFALPQKSRLDVSTGLPCNHHCGWNLFKGGCGVVETSYDQTVDIDSVDGASVTITTAAFTSPGSTDARYWKRGYLEKDGLRIAIRDYDGAASTSVAHMADDVPTDWIGGSLDIRAVPGCDKTIETCRARYNAEQYNLSMGYAMLPYQPNFETPS